MSEHDVTDIDVSYKREARCLFGGISYIYTKIIVATTQHITMHLQDIEHNSSLLLSRNNLPVSQL